MGAKKGKSVPEATTVRSNNEGIEMNQDQLRCGFNCIFAACGLSLFLKHREFTLSKCTDTGGSTCLSHGRKIWIIHSNIE